MSSNPEPSLSVFTTDDVAQILKMNKPVTTIYDNNYNNRNSGNGSKSNRNNRSNRRSNNRSNNGVNKSQKYGKKDYKIPALTPAETSQYAVLADKVVQKARDIVKFSMKYPTLVTDNTDAKTINAEFESYVENCVALLKSKMKQDELKQE